MNNELVQTGSQALEDPRCVEIYRKMGDIAAMHARWNYTTADYIYNNIGRCERAGVPSLVMMRKTYGDKAIIAVIAAHLGYCLQRLNISDKFSNTLILDIAQSIACNKDNQTLTFSRVLAFFVWLKMGNYIMHGYTPAQIMSAWSTYLPQALNAQLRAYNEIEREKRDAQEQEQRANAITFEEYCKAKGITGENPLEKCLEM